MYYLTYTERAGRYKFRIIIGTRPASGAVLEGQPEGTEDVT